MSAVVPVRWLDSWVVCWWFYEHGRYSVTMCGKNMPDRSNKVSFQDKGTAITCLFCVVTRTRPR